MSQEPEIEDIPHVDLADELAAPTPKVTFQTDDSFEEEDTVDEDLPGGDSSGDNDADDDYQEDEVKPLGKAEARALAKQLVDDFSALQKTALAGFVYPNTILKKGDFTLEKEYKQGSRSVAHDAAKSRVDEYEHMVSTLPFTREEKDQIAKPLSAVILKYQTMVKMGPEFSLVLAVFLVMLPRLEPMLANLFSPKKP